MNSALPTQLLTCRCGEYTIGFDVQVVQEVLTEQLMTKIPRAPGSVCGLLNLRGDVVPAVFLHKNLNIPGVAEGVSYRHLILNLAHSTISLLVDEVGEVLELQPEQYFKQVGGLQAPFKELIVGVYHTSELTVLHLDPEASCRLFTEAGIVHAESGL
jgi:purine-binding chemotaxis protein CheW